ncbi:uncharacterized protein LOC115068366 [Nannospalax galili]|uniref:uncharacterized protein LOC115068366 n=1 Tax=Nannospalax galili TaxID=1026970 RepID=UPI00111C1A73|nr:uncharacterized protein LOC115068366 [Nannospalax galili]
MRYACQTTWESLNVPTRNAVAAVCNDDIHKWVLATRYLHPASGPIAALTASLDALLSDRQQSNDCSKGANPPHRTCWGYGKLGAIVPMHVLRPAAQIATRAFTGPVTTAPSPQALSGATLSPASKRVKFQPQGILDSVFPHSPMKTVYLDGLPVKGLADTGADVTTLMETEALRFPHWKFKPGPSATRVGGQQATRATAQPVHWKDLDGNQGSFSPIVANASRNLWGRDILKDMGTILTTDNRAFFDDIITHDKIGLSGRPDHSQNHPQV